MPVLTYEAGEALRFDEVSVRAGLRGILNTMRLIGMLPRLKNDKSIARPVIARSSTWVRAPTSGIVSAKVKLGSSVTIGQRLAIISDPLGMEETNVVATIDGIVIGCSNLPLSHEGDALFHLGGFKSIPRAEGVVESFTVLHDDDQ
jgi:predicted deacylase